MMDLSRGIPDTQAPGQDMPDSPCLFCGEVLKHVNDGGEGWILGSVVEGEVRYFMYHNNHKCMSAEDSDSIWRCACEPSYVENVGDECHACRKKNGEHTVWTDDDWKARP